MHQPSKKMNNFKTISFSKLKDIDPTKLHYFLERNITNADPKNKDINATVKDYDEVLRSALQEKAPIMRKEVKIKNKLPWFNSNIKIGICERHKLERKEKRP